MAIRGDNKNNKESKRIVMNIRQMPYYIKEMIDAELDCAIIASIDKFEKEDNTKFKIEFEIYFGR